MKFNWSKAAPHLVAIGVFIVLALIYCKPLLDGKVLSQGDILVHKGMSKEIADHRAKYGEEPLWLGSAFSGMPAFTISVKYPSNVADKVQQAFNSLLPHPVRFIFLLALGFYILLLSFKIDPWLSIAGALVFAFSSNFMISIEAGHNSKVLAIAYLPAVVGAAVMAFNGRWLIGAILGALFGALLINSGHFQVIYYAMIVLLLIGITYLVKAIREKTVKVFWKPVAALAVAGLAAAAPNFSRLYNMNSHTPETMRGGSSELSVKKSSGGGLEFEYALNDWSYGMDEPLTLMFPFYESGASNEVLGSNSKSVETINRYARVEELGVPLYRGPQRFHSPIYIGAAVFFLFFMGVFVIKGYNRWWIFATALLSIVFAWGSHFAPFNKLLFEHLPLFNKFRTPTMALCLIGMAIPLFGMMAVNKLMRLESRPELMKAFKRAAIVASVFVVMALLVGLTSDFSSPNDTMRQANGQERIVVAEQYSDQLFGNDPAGASQKRAFEESFLTAVQADRQSLYMKGLLRSLIFLGLAAGLIFLFIKGRIKRPFLIGGLAALLLVDVWALSRRYFNDDNFIAEEEYAKAFSAPASSQDILMNDPDPHYRVLRFGQGMFSDGVTSYYHKNVLGNSAVKVQLYQDLIQVTDSIPGLLNEQINRIPSIFQAAGSDLDMVQFGFERQAQVLNMLNTKYIIVGPNTGASIRNESALGNAWFVNFIEFVPDADAEYAVLKRENFNPANSAVVQEKYRPQVQEQTYFVDSGYIKLTSYKANHLEYESQNNNQGFAVFSEIYYKNGWNCYVDGKNTPIIKVNYALRGVKVPAGNHKIEMKFEPESYPKGEKIGTVGSLLWGVVVLGGVGWIVWQRRKKTKPATAQ